MIDSSCRIGYHDAWPDGADKEIDMMNISTRFLPLKVLALVLYAHPGSAQVYDEMFDPSCRLLQGIDTVSVGKDMEPWVFTVEGVKENAEQSEAQSTTPKLTIRVLKTGRVVQVLDNFADIEGLGLTDINIDGYLDLRVEGHPMNLSPTFEFWTFSQQKAEFEMNPAFSGLNDYSIDVEKRQIRSSSQETGGRGGETTVYEVIDEGLNPIEYTSENRLDFEHQQLVSGMLQTVGLRSFLEESDDMGTLSTYHRKGDSLCLVEKVWIHIGVEPTQLEMANKVADCEPWGCYVFLKKEKYEYELVDGIQQIKRTLRYKVENSKWQPD